MTRRQAPFLCLLTKAGVCTGERYDLDFDICRWHEWIHLTNEGCALATTEKVKGSTFEIPIWMIDNDDIQRMLIMECFPG